MEWDRTKQMECATFLSSLNYNTVQVIEISMFRELILIISQKLNNKQERKIMLKFGDKNYNRETDSVAQLEGGTHV